MGHRLLTFPLGLAVGLLTVVAALWPLGTARATAPALTLEPERGPCPAPNSIITVRGANFPPGMTVELLSIDARYISGVVRLRIGTVTVTADGTFSIPAHLAGCGPSVPDGTRFVIEAVDSVPPPGGGRLTVLTTATFTVASSPSGLPNTGGGGTQLQASGLAEPLILRGILVVLGCIIRSYASRRRWVG